MTVKYMPLYAVSSVNLLLLYPRTKSGILRIQHGRAATAAVEISFVNDNSKNILLSPFKFGMWVEMG